MRTEWKLKTLWKRLQSWGVGIRQNPQGGAVFVTVVYVLNAPEPLVGCVDESVASNVRRISPGTELVKDANGKVY